MAVGISLFGTYIEFGLFSMILYLQPKLFLKQLIFVICCCFLEAQENEEEAKCDDNDNLASNAEGEKEALKEENEAENEKGQAATFDDVTDSTAINGKGRKEDRAKVVTSGGDESFWADYVFTRKFLLHVVFVSVNQLKIYIFLSIINDFLDSFNLTEEKS